MRVDTRYWQNLLVLLLGICILKTGAAMNDNREVYRGYTQRYEPLNLDWGGQEMVDYIDRNRFFFDVPGYNQTAYTVTLTRPLRYYTQPSAFSKVAVELGAGQRVVHVSYQPPGLEVRGSSIAYGVGEGCGAALGYEL